MHKYVVWGDPPFVTEENTSTYLDLQGTGIVLMLIILSHLYSGNGLSGCEFIELDRNNGIAHTIQTWGPKQSPRSVIAQILNNNMLLQHDVCMWHCQCHCTVPLKKRLLHGA